MNAKSRSRPAQRGHPDDGSAERAGLRLLLGWLRPWRAGLVVTLALMLLESLVTLLNPWLAGRFAAAVLQQQALTGLMGAWFGVIVVQGLLAWMVAVRTQSIGAQLSADASVRVFERLQLLPLRWHRDRRRGDVLALLLRDVDYLAGFVTATLIPLLPLLLTCAGAVVMMARIEPWFALAAAVLVPAMYVAMRWSGRKLRPLGKAANDAYVARSIAAEQSLAMLPVVKAFTGEARESLRFDDRARALRDFDIRLARVNAAVGPAVRVLSAAAILALLWLASRELATGQLDAQGLVSLLLYGLLLTRPVSSLAGVYGHAHSAHAVVQRLVDVFAAPPEPAGGSLAPSAVRGEVVFDRVAFRYPGREAVLSGVNLRLRPGETVAITGANGAGKSTMMHLLMRFAAPDDGRILLDGHDLGDYQLRALRSHIGLVPQTVLLFSGSIRENIGYGRVDASDAEIEQAARLAQAHQFIVGLEHGYDTRVGDDGVHLSGGQRQRLALARALLKNPAVLILDEATAMFDPDGERALVQACHDVLHQRSVLLITHRPASLALADRVLRLDDGRLCGVDEAAREPG